MLFSIIILLIGLGLLVIGGELLVRGSSSIAHIFKVSPLVIGLTIVAFGTSAPELIVNLISVVEGSADIAVGNIIGSNIANILLIGGLAALIRPLIVKNSTVWKEIPFALLAVILVFTMGNDALFDGNSFNILTRTDGFSLLSMFFIFLIYTFNMSKDEYISSGRIKVYSKKISLIFIIIGLIGLFFGGKLVVEQAIILARLAQVTEALIGLTIVAIGTSLPELVTSLIAIYHGHDDLAIGNIVGSNIFNVFWILGLSSTILQLPFNPLTNIDIMMAIVANLLLFAFMFIGSKKKLDRWQGCSLVIIYVLYLVYLIYRG
ncbi:MAG: sodium:proton exchanger [Candidatus Komeilibacteria bacterium CG_4_10_14_0_2_um_filter_37_10]|uniref:Sodium:proton exchanger n=1 Tax=Candidatus Komeilibacteria bacterium CG_4_10_14_0_2_um_filter_37_10 TaxID=1974470 RepID=A0A2M7VFZ7_9BACT|nr:MAG: sodium:proton exchanger [Candidatus Komeilibacteria bacterium CG_4_10_14_0_2_um_filter_37_10]PJA92739.1 MAG: sodium:proton exchanger [Candidatus Komeilibacteria bacterium CG_4_9_14_3_um_filter_37_5]